MALLRPLFLVLLLGITMPLLFFSRTEAAEVGVSYGRVANDLPQNQGSVVDLLKQNGITMVRIYDAFPDVLTSLANTGIKVMVMMPNENLAAAASDPSNALQWVQTNVQAFYPATLINGVAVGNEVFDSRPDLNSVLVPAMTNVQAALAQLGLADAVKVSTPVAFDALQTSYPPSQGSFKDELVPVMKSMLDFLQRTGSYLTVNIYPFFAYYDSLTTPNPISLDYALGNSGAAAVLDDNTDVTYTNLLDAQLDATYYAMEGLGFTSVSLHTTESGWPSHGKPNHGKPPSEVRRGGRRLLDSAADQDTAASVANAQAYNNNLINRVLAGRTGTPHRPDADMDVYIFALFNENGKGDADDTESNFGLFYPNETKVYSFDFQGTGAPPLPPRQSWCVANAAVGDARLQEALDYACGNGADCSAIQPGGSCFQPDTVLAHASYAFNSYYQNKGRASGTCNFNGAGSIVYQEPTGTCSAPVSWCVANAAVGDARLQTALDYACSNGADCSAIQPGGACFQPDTTASHASYAFNSYYQHNYRASGTCDFSGAGSIVYQQPSEFIAHPLAPAPALVDSLSLRPARSPGVTDS
ncbi:hypothetical protein U9M48_015484 [Paspalum notatum var. saurae]|uniref:X8 domain-containing protein n=1 Tax=Paspalum notatum var. saurae TaxID=547442 RepID=A0AAQ3T4Y9_PASNO